MHYNGKNIPLAKNLRKNMTPWERKLGYLFLRNYPVKFYRQRAIEEYIVDFYCSKANLIIELDGSGHCDPMQEKKDSIRDEKLKTLGYNVLRISNIDIDKNFQGVCDFIDLMVRGGK